MVLFTVCHAHELCVAAKKKITYKSIKLTLKGIYYIWEKAIYSELCQLNKFQENK